LARRLSGSPEEVQNRLDQMYPDVPKLELFTRRQRLGWVCLGDELTGGDIRENLRRLAVVGVSGIGIRKHLAVANKGA
jgi:N6-adenosine-specific RNA methylase IME4